jgi:hypothetical protein
LDFTPRVIAIAIVPNCGVFAKRASTLACTLGFFSTAFG